MTTESVDSLVAEAQRLERLARGFDVLRAQIRTRGTFRVRSRWHAVLAPFLRWMPGGQDLVVRSLNIERVVDPAAVDAIYEASFDAQRIIQERAAAIRARISVDET